MKYICAVLLMWVLLGACTKEASNEFVPDPNNPQNDTAWTNTIADNASVNQLIEMMSLPYLADSFDIVTGGTVHCGVNNGQVNFPSNCLQEAVTGKIKVEFIYLKSKGDMVRCAKPTISDNRILISGGAFYIKVSQNGMDYQLAANAKIKITYSAAKPDAAMQLFYGDTAINSTDGFNWIADADTSLVSNWVVQDSTGLMLGYQLLSPKFGWINCDRFSDTSMPRTNLITTLPVNFTNSNTAVFAVFKDQWSVLRLNADAANKYFYAPGLPVGSNITLIGVSMIGNDLYLSSKEIKVTVDKLEALVPQKSTLEEIIQFTGTL